MGNFPHWISFYLAQREQGDLNRLETRPEETGRIVDSVMQGAHPFRRIRR